MKALIQRVSQANVHVNHELIGEIQQGILLLLGIEKGDSQEQADKLIHKVANYRIFSDKDNKMNLSVSDINGGILVISQFTLAAETSKGLRPGFSNAEHPEKAKALYEYFYQQLHEKGITTATGSFGADMQVSLINDGPVTFMLEA